MIEYIKESELQSRYQQAIDHAKKHHKPFPEFERIARNRPHPGIADGLPKVTDGTIASNIQKQPRRVIQQIPTGKVTAKSKWLSVLGGYILENEILANADHIAELIQKCWGVAGKSETYGSQGSIVQFLQKGDKFTTDFSLPYIKDSFLEPGKLGRNDSDVIFFRTYYQPGQIDAIIAQCKEQKRRAKEEGYEYESEWDIEALEKVKQAFDEKDADSRTPNEEEKGVRTEAIELGIAFQNGIKAKFYTFSPKLNLVVRRKVNKDPRGVMPVQWMYYEFDFFNPYGRGIVELAGGMQNLLDSEVQTYQYQRLLGMRPTTNVYGNVPRSAIKNKPNSINFIKDPNARIEYQQVSTTAIERFPDNYGLIKSQIMSLLATQDHSVSAEAGNPGFSKTSAGVKARESMLGFDDNHLRRQFEAWWQEVAETMLNLYFAEREGVMELELDEATAKKFRKVAPEGSISDDNKVRIDFSDETEPLTFKVDPSTSAKEDEQQQVEVLLGLLERVENSPLLSQLIPPEKLAEVWNTIVASSGIQDPEKLQIDLENQQGDQNAQAQGGQPQMTPDDVAAMIEEALASQAPSDDPLIKVFRDLPESAKKQVLAKYGIDAPDDSTSQQELNIKKFDAAQRAAGPSDVELDAQMPAMAAPEDASANDEKSDTLLIQALSERGYNDEQITIATDMLKNEASNEDIMAAIGMPGVQA